MKSLPTRWRQLQFSFPLSVLLSVCLLLVSEYSYQRSVGIAAALDEALTARSQLHKLERLVLDAETGQRGYLLTGTPEYLKPYQEATVAVEQALKPLRKRYQQHPTVGDEFDQLDSNVQKKMTELSLTVALRSAGDDSWRAIIDTEAGLRHMEIIRRSTDVLRDYENDAIAHYHQTLRQTLLINRIGIAAMTALSLLALALYLRQTAQMASLREEHARQLEADRDTLERQVQDRTLRLTRLMAYLQNVREDERARLARELHDELGALLVAAKLDLARLKSHLPEADAYLKERLFHLGEALNNGISLKRRIIEELHPSSLSKLGLTAALEILVGEFAQRCSVEIECKFATVALTPTAELTVYRLVQESLTNIAKYAQATRIEVQVQARQNYAEIRVRDNGKGFDIDNTPASAHGLEGMQYRVAANGGEMKVVSAIGAGTEIIAVMPLADLVKEKTAAV